jgi:hypothetical protein
MLQVFSLNVAKVDLDITYTCMLQAYVSKCFIWILHMFAMFFRHFHKCFIRLFQVFHLSFFLYVATVASQCFKSRSIVMRMGSGWQRERRSGWHERRSGWRGPTAGVLAPSLCGHAVWTLALGLNVRMLVSPIIQCIFIDVKPYLLFVQYGARVISA